MSQVKTFRAASMSEALAIVRREFGSDAVILNTRYCSKRRLLPFLPRREHVEITAGSGINVRSQHGTANAESPGAHSGGISSPAAIEKPVATQRSGSAGIPLTHQDSGIDLSAPPRGGLPGLPPELPDSALARAALLAAEVEKRNMRKAQLADSLTSLRTSQDHSRSQLRRTGENETVTTTIPGSINPAPVTRTFEPGHESAMSMPTPSTPHPVSRKASTDTTSDMTTARAASLMTPTAAESVSGMGTTHDSDDSIENPPPNQAASLAAAAQQRHAESPSVLTSELASKLDTLQKMVENLTRSTHLRGGDEIPGELFEVYTQLIDADVEDDLARELIFSLRQCATTEQLHDPTACRALLSGLVESDIRCAKPIKPTAGKRRVVALVGPTGVGKTTTIAKLAANFRLRDGIRMGLVTVDTYRIAAVEQLRTYAEIIDLPMKVVTSPREMRRALDELSGLDLVLIDTAGRSPRDDLKIQELKTMLAEASVDEVHLVMSLTASVRSIRMTCEQFRPVEPTALVLTKLDEAAGMGSLLSVSRQVSMPLSYLTTGQDVPEDIEPASASRISRLVLGLDRVFG